MHGLSWFFLLLLTCSSHFSWAKSCKKIPLKSLSLEADFCWDCMGHNNNSQWENLTTPFVPTRNCFQRSISHRNSYNDKNTFCEDNSLVTKRGPICINDKSYIDTTARAFHEVSQCLNIENPSFFFALLNRESRFQITATSQTGASCYGQLTGVAIADINQKLIPAQVKDYKKCQPLNKNFEPLTNSGRRKTRSAICTSHNNPYSCLFYSGLYYKEAVRQAEKTVSEAGDALSVKFKNKSQSFIFQNEREYQKYLAKNNLKESQVEKKEPVSLFKDPKTIAQIIALHGYNGGPQSIRNLFTQYSNTIKGRVWSSHHPDRKSYQNAVFSNPYGIPTSDFVHTFSKYIKKNYRVRHAGQTASFFKNILNDFESVTRNNPACGDIPVRKLKRPAGRFKAKGLI